MGPVGGEEEGAPGPCPGSPAEILNALSLSLSLSPCVALYCTGSLWGSSSRISLDRSPSLIPFSELVFVLLSPYNSERMGAPPSPHFTQPAIYTLPMRIFFCFSFKVSPLGIEIKATHYFSELSDFFHNEHSHKMGEGQDFFFKKSVSYTDVKLI